MKDDIITLAHGGGGSLYRQLVEEVFLPAFDNPYLRQLNDAAVCPCPSSQIAVTTDSFVVRPRFFPGGDLGRLAVCGTVNDLAMSGAEPAYLTVGMILEAGLPIEELKRICASMAEAAAEAGVSLVTGDTKVVEKGAGDGIYINTAGVGLFPTGRKPLPQVVREGDIIIASGDLGQHGLAILAAREGFDFEPPLTSDCAPLNQLTRLLLEAAPQVSALRDPTRGGAAATLNEWAAASGLEINLKLSALPIAESTASACELLGLDPLYIANEGKFLAALPASEAEAALAALNSAELGRRAAMIGRAAAGPARVTADSPWGGRRVVDMPVSELLPRIC